MIFGSPSVRECLLPDLGPDDAPADQTERHENDHEADDGAGGHRRHRRGPSEAVGELLDQSVLR